MIRHPLRRGASRGKNKGLFPGPSFLKGARPSFRPFLVGFPRIWTWCLGPPGTKPWGRFPRGGGKPLGPKNIPREPNGHFSPKTQGRKDSWVFPGAGGQKSLGFQTPRGKKKKNHLRPPPGIWGKEPFFFIPRERSLTPIFGCLWVGGHLSPTGSHWGSAHTGGEGVSFGPPVFYLGALWFLGTRKIPPLAPFCLAEKDFPGNFSLGALAGIFGRNPPGGTKQFFTLGVFDPGSFLGPFKNHRGGAPGSLDSQPFSHLHFLSPRQGGLLRPPG